MAFSGVLIGADQSVAGRAGVWIGTATSPYTSIDASIYSVGALDGTVSISPNQDVVKLQRSDGQNPYAVLETAYDFQVSFSLQETDIYNLGLALSYNTHTSGAIVDDAATTAGSGNSTTGVATPIDLDGSGTAAKVLTLGSDNQSPYRSMLIRVEGGKVSGTRFVAEWHFFKVKIQATGSIDYDRTGAVSYPVTAHCLGNSSDVVGKFITPSTFDTGRTAFYGDS